MKLWHTPSLEELNLNATEYSIGGGHNVDGTYTSISGAYTENTYASSSGNNGTPSINNGPDHPNMNVK